MSYLQFVNDPRPHPLSFSNFVMCLFTMHQDWPSSQAAPINCSFSKKIGAALSPNFCKYKLGRSEISILFKMIIRVKLQVICHA